MVVGRFIEGMAVEKNSKPWKLLIYADGNE
jgi:hypothetical protein